MMNVSQHPLLGRRPARQAPQVTFVPGRPDLAMICGRVHEGCGPARHTLALWLAAQMQGTVLWILPGWSPSRLHAEGMADWAEPGRFLFVTAQRAEDVLWSMEEALRSGAVPLVVADLPGPPGLTAVRRMHLAAETGTDMAGRAPLGLLLTPDEGGAQGVESRWHLRGDHGSAQLGQWKLSRLRARTAPQATWTIVRQGRSAPAPLEVKVA
jgi:protein ImuA